MFNLFIQFFYVNNQIILFSLINLGEMLCWQYVFGEKSHSNSYYIFGQFLSDSKFTQAHTGHKHAWQEQASDTRRGLVTGQLVSFISGTGVN